MNDKIMIPQMIPPCYEAPKGDMVMEKIDIGGKMILQLFCVCSIFFEKTQKPFTFFCKNVVFV